MLATLRRGKYKQKNKVLEHLHKIQCSGRRLGKTKDFGLFADTKINKDEYITFFDGNIDTEKNAGYYKENYRCTLQGNNVFVNSRILMTKIKSEPNAPFYSASLGYDITNGPVHISPDIRVPAGDLGLGSFANHGKLAECNAKLKKLECIIHGIEFPVMTLQATKKIKLNEQIVINYGTGRFGQEIGQLHKYANAGGGSLINKKSIDSIISSNIASPASPTRMALAQRIQDLTDLTESVKSKSNRPYLYSGINLPYSANNPMEHDLEEYLKTKTEPGSSSAYKPSHNMLLIPPEPKASPIKRFSKKAKQPFDELSSLRLHKIIAPKLSYTILLEGLLREKNNPLTKRFMKGLDWNEKKVELYLKRAKSSEGLETKTVSWDYIIHQYNLPLIEHN